MAIVTAVKSTQQATLAATNWPAIAPAQWAANRTTYKKTNGAAFASTHRFSNSAAFE